MVDGQTSEVGGRAQKPVEVGSRKELDPAPNLNQLMAETTVQEKNEDTRDCNTNKLCPGKIIYTVQQI